MVGNNNDSELLLKISNGDEHAFSELFQLYHPHIYTAAVKLLHQPAAAEEVVQDVFLAVWTQRSTLPAISNFGGWLNTVARNNIFTAFKRSLRNSYDPLNSLDELIASQPSTENQLIAKDLALILNSAVDTLPPKQKLTWQLVREQGLKREEAARKLNVSPETVKFNLEEAVRKVRAYCMVRMRLIIFCFISAALFK